MLFVVVTLIIAMAQVEAGWQPGRKRQSPDIHQEILTPEEAMVRRLEKQESQAFVKNLALFVGACVLGMLIFAFRGDFKSFKFDMTPPSVKEKNLRYTA